MKTLDRWLQRWRVSKARPYIRQGARVLDVGCADGTLFEHYAVLIQEGVGIDPDLPRSVERGRYRLISGRFPGAMPDDRSFDVITLLAVLEHVPQELKSQLALDCARFLKPGGYLVVTVPSLRADSVLGLLLAVRLIDGMSLEQHHGFDPRQTRSVFEPCGLRLVRASRFQLGFNNLFVFQKPLGEAAQDSA